MKFFQHGWLALTLSLTSAFALLNAGAAVAQPFPSKPVRVIVTFPPGGTPDIYGRILAQELSTLWKQSVLVENKTGAGGAIGTDFVATDVASILKRPDFQERMTADALEPVGGTPEEFAAQIAAGLGSWSRLIRAANIRVD